MDKLKYFIVALIIIILIAVISIVLIINNSIPSAKNDGKDNEEREFYTEYKEKNKGKIQTVDSISDFELAQVCLQKFYIYYSLIFDESVINLDESVEFNLDYYKRALCDLLTTEYKDNHGITSENVNSKLEKNNFDTVEIYNIYYVTNFENSKVYFINGLLRNSETYETKEFDNTLYIDNSLQSFKVSLDNDLNSDYKDLKIGEEVSYIVPQIVSGGSVNVFNYPSTSYEEFGKRTFDNIRILMLRNPDIAYEMLDDVSKNNFGSLQKFKEYIERNRKNLFLMSFGEYETNFVNDIFTITIYDSNSKFSITIYYDSFSKFTYDIIDM